MDSDVPQDRSAALPPAPDAARRESVRRNFLRANTAVAIVLVAVLGLALAAVLASLRATHHQRLAEQAQEAARTELWHTYLSKARAARLGLALDRRQESLRAITSAVEIRSSPELRDEAIAALALIDFVREKSWPLSEDATTQAFDRELDRYAVGWANGDISIQRVSDNQILQWLRRTNGEVPSAQGPVIGLEFSPDGERLAARHQMGGLVVWDIARAGAVYRQAMDKPRHALSRPRFTSDGRFLICMTDVPRMGVDVVDLATGQSTAHFPQFPPWMHAAPRPGTKMFSVNTESNVVMVVDWSTGQTVMSFPFPAGVQRTVWSQDGRYLAISGNTVDVHLWDMDTGQKRILTGHTAEVRHLTFDPTGERLASASWDATSRIWETRSGRLLGVTDQGFAEQFGPGGRLALSRHKGAVEVWALRPSPVHRTHLGPGPSEAATWALDLSPDSRWLASVSVGKGLLLWDLVGDTMPGWFEIPGVRLFAFHPERPELYLAMPLALTARKLSFGGAADAPVPQVGEAISLPLPTNYNPGTVAFSGDGRTMALASYYEGKTFVADPAAPTNLVWLQDLGHLTQGETHSLTASATGGGTLALSRDGRWAACGFVFPRGIKVWDAKSGGCIATLGVGNAIVQFSPDDRWLVAGDRSQFQLFKTADWQPLWRVAREGALLTAGPCAFSPDGRRLAVAKSPQTAALLDAATGRELAELVAPRPATIKVMRWSRDGRLLVVGTGENVVQVWALDALQHELAARGLDWDAPAVSSAAGLASAAALARGHRSGPVWASVLGLFAAGIVTLIALGALRRHRRLIEDFARTEALAGERERELQIEREVSRLKGSFVSMVSHEFRTPLGVITASAGNLERYFARLSEEQRAQLLGDITSASSRMKGLIEEVLLLGKVESGTMNCRREPTDLPALCRRAVAEVSTATGNVCPIELTCGQFDGEARVDETLAGIVLTNLLSNAVKYSPRATAVGLSLRRDGQDCVFEVRDQGLGIPAGDQAELFKSFHRGTNVGNIPGTGLGLTIVKRCVDLHGGSIGMVSAVGQGTTFTVRLPAFDEGTRRQPRT